MLLDSAIRAVKGDLSNKDAFRTSLRQAKFASVRGNFRFNNNQFPIQDWYIRSVVAEGSATRIVTGEKIFDQVEDRFAKECAMKF